MSFGDYVILGIVAVWFVGAVWVLIRNRRQGKSACGCGGGCSGCRPKQNAHGQSHCGGCDACSGCSGGCSEGKRSGCPEEKNSGCSDEKSSGCSGGKNSGCPEGKNGGGSEGKAGGHCSLTEKTEQR